MRQGHGGNAGGVGRLVVTQPAKLGERERGDRYRAGTVCKLAGADLSDQLSGGGGAAGVVPQQRRSDHPPFSIQDDHAVLLARD